MNYPVWPEHSGGLLIAGMAILHVFISHFAVGGGLFLLVYEWQARRRRDPELLNYVRLHSRFFVLVTLVFGALTGVGIWFTIGLVQPQATSTLIQTFVWIWAIEWTFFFVEIAAALFYFYGWDRLSARRHLLVGFIYFVSAWMSLFVINGILTFMLTPGTWISSRSLYEAFLNPTFWPSLVARTLAAVGLAGLYALLTASWLHHAELKRRIARLATLGWILPSVILLPPVLHWYLARASGSGIPVAEILGVTPGALISLPWRLWTGGSLPNQSYPPATYALALLFLASVLLTGTLLLLGSRAKTLLRPVTGLFAMVLGLLVFGSAEWIREDLRKPFVLTDQLFVNSVRLPLQYSTPDEFSRDPLSIVSLRETGVWARTRWKKGTSQESEKGKINTGPEGSELFRLLCSSCHSLDGYLAIRPLVQGQSRNSLASLLGNLAKPVTPAGESAEWGDPDMRLATWRGRRMPPFAGNDEEKWILAGYLAELGGTSAQKGGAVPAGADLFDTHCGVCHGEDADWPIRSVAAGHSLEELEEKIQELPEVNPIMPPFEGSAEERRQLAKYILLRTREAGEER